RLAVDNASDNPLPPEIALGSRLNAFAVLAFCAEMTRLPGHCDARFVPVKATAQTMPSRSTMVAHMFMLRPLPSVFVAATRAAFSFAWLGRALHPLLSPSLSAKAEMAQNVNADASTVIRLNIDFLLSWLCLEWIALGSLAVRARVPNRDNP